MPAWACGHSLTASCPTRPTPEPPGAAPSSTPLGAACAVSSMSTASRSPWSTRSSRRSGSSPGTARACWPPGPSFRSRPRRRSGPPLAASATRPRTSAPPPAGTGPAIASCSPWASSRAARCRCTIPAATSAASPRSRPRRSSTTTAAAAPSTRAAPSLASLLWPEHAPPPPHLTRRERELLPLLEAGLRFKQIARELSISEPTAKGYARDMFRKLGVSSRAEAVFEARRQGLL